jgi:hypothetical protein
MEETKKKVNFNVDVKTLNEFNKTSKLKAINKSQLIENFMKTWILENK